MKKTITICMLMFSLFCSSGCQKVWYLFLECVVDIAPNRFFIEENDELCTIPVFSSHSLTKEDNDVEYLILIVHGAGLNAGKAFESGRSVAESLEIPENRVMVVAPQFLEGVNPDEKGLLLWGANWRSGGNSLSSDLDRPMPVISSYEVLDQLVDAVARRHPNLRRVVILGHSAGGQFVSRYAALNDNHETLVKQGILLHYIASNPSSYLYLDKKRYHFDADKEIVEITQRELNECPGYNKYKYGLEELDGYSEKFSPELIRRRILKRPVMFLNGAADTERSRSLDKSCEGDSQGENRYLRWLLYRHHLGAFAKDGIESRLVWSEIPEVGHAAAEIFAHPKFIEALKTFCSM